LNNLTNSSNRPALTVAEIAARVGAQLTGDGTTVITGAAPIESAGEHDICFVANPAYKKYIPATRAAAIVLDPQTPCSHIPVLRHANPYLTFAYIIDLLYPDEPYVDSGVHDSSQVHPSASVDPTCRVGPLCSIAKNARLGAGTTLVSSVHIGSDVTIGDNCLIHPGVRIMRGCTIGNRVILQAGVVIGSDGFGFAPSDTGLKKIKQVGWVEVADDVEIGANTTIDRGALGPTRIGRGTKIDNLVQIAHNVEIGENCVIVSQVGISGSTKLGNGVMLAGQVGLVGHLEIGDGVKIGAQSGVTHSIPPGRIYFGSPALEGMEAKRIEAARKSLPELIRRVRKLEKKLGEE
jgi:UDP-3-O-[3-hydroxymyristoyl] glucosamine N-acyltransferase